MLLSGMRHACTLSSCKRHETVTGGDWRAALLSWRRVKLIMGRHQVQQGLHGAGAVWAPGFLRLAWLRAGGSSGGT